MIYTRTVGWDEFYAALDRTFGRMAGESFDLVVAIAQGGIVPGALVREELDLAMRVVRLSFRDPSNAPLYDDARLLEADPFPHAGKRILLVDDVSRTGKTLARAREYLAGNEVRTLLVNGKADYSLFETDECLRMPWKREK